VFCGPEAAAGLLLSSGHRALTRVLINWKETKNSSKKQYGLGKMKRNVYLESQEQNAGRKSKYICVSSLGKTSLFSILSQAR